MSQITEETVQHIAELSRIALHDDEASLYAQNLASVLGYVDQLNAIDTTDTEALLQVNGLKNVLRADVVTNGNNRAALLANAPLTENGLLKVKVVK